MKTKMHRNAGPSVFYHARIMRQNPTPAEEKLWLYVRNNQLGCKFRRQHPMDIFVMDFYCHFHNLVIEVDGESHLDNEVQAKDLEKEAYIHNEGLYLLRFTNYQVMFDIENVIDKIYETFSRNKYISPPF